MLTYVLWKLSKNTFIRHKLGIRPCANFLEKKLAVKYKLALETSAVTFDVGLVSLVGSRFLTHLEMKNRPVDEYGTAMFFTTIGCTLLALSYSGTPILLLVSYRAYKSWKLNKLTIATNPAFHIFF